MILQYCSDLHLEFLENKEFIKQNPLRPKGDILLLAGDIVPFAIMDKSDEFFDSLSDSFETVYWLPGNHEYYKSDAANRSGVVHEKIRNNIFLVNNMSVVQGSTRLIFTTLWSEISPLRRLSLEHNITDFHAIKFHRRPFSGAIFNHFHHEAIDFLQDELSQAHKGKTVVISHHVPTLLNYPEKYRDNSLNEAFAVELYDLIESSPIDYWIYGHHHNNTPDFNIGNTTLLTNQLGYVRYDEQTGFMTDKIISL